MKITFSSSEISDPDPADGVLFDGIEVAVLVEGVEAGRVWPADAARWILRKLEDPRFRVTRTEALGDVGREEAAPAATFRDFLAHLGLRLESVEVGVAAARVTLGVDRRAA